MSRYANVTATLALFVALSGSAYAAVELPADSVGTPQLKSGAVTGAKIATGTIRAANVATRSLTGSVIAESTLAGNNVIDGSLTGADLGPGAIGLRETGSRPSAKVIGGGDVPSGPTPHLVDLDVEDEDTDDMVTPGRPEILIRRPGIYVVTAKTGWLGGGTGGARAIQLLNCPPGTSTACSIEDFATAADNAFNPYFGLVDVVRLTAGRRLQMTVRQNSGRSLGQTSSLSATWLAP
jgi:hypothetical protein